MKHPENNRFNTIAFRCCWIALPVAVVAVLLPESVRYFFSEGHSLEMAPGEVNGPVEIVWLARFEGDGRSLARPSAVAFSADGDSLFVTGVAGSRDQGPAVTTIAYSVAGGKTLWTSREPVDNLLRAASGLAVCPSGERLYIAGWRIEEGTNRYVLVAYDVGSGERLWEQRFEPGAARFTHDFATSPGGDRVYVSGAGRSRGGEHAVLLMACDSATGAVLWEARRCLPAGTTVRETRVAREGEGDGIFLADRFSDGRGGTLWRVAAYAGQPGRLQWDSVYALPGEFHLRGILAESRSGTVWVTGSTSEPGGGAVIVFNGDCGEVLWHDVRLEEGAWGGGVAADGRALVARGVDRLVAYEGVSGERFWERTMPFRGRGASLAFAREGRSLIVAGQRARSSGRPMAASYDTDSGAERWTLDYSDIGTIAGITSDVAVAPGGRYIAVTGISVHPRGRSEFVTLLLRELGPSSDPGE